MPSVHIFLAVMAVIVAAWIINRYAPLAGRTRTFLNVVLALIVIGILLWLINTYIPMAGSIKAILNIVVVVATCVWIMKIFGIWNEIVTWWSDFTHHRT